MSGQNRESEPSQQIDIRSEVIEGSKIKMKITDLNIICLEEIFEYLDLENLLNVADSNKRLNIAACFVFQRKYGEKIVKVLHYRIPCYPHNNPMQLISSGIFLSDVKISLRFLRCFGCITSNIEIFFQDFSQEQVDEICFYMNEYCADSLIKLAIDGYKTSAITFKYFQKPFLNIEKVFFGSCNLEKNVMQFNKWFPKMRHLILYENQIVEKECIEMNFPNLRHLTYRPKYNDIEGDIKSFPSHFENLFRLNPNLRSLYTNILIVKHLQIISNYLPQLEELQFLTYDIKSDYAKDYDIGQVHFKSLKKLQIYTDSVFSEILPKINFSFDQLEEFDVFEIKFNDLLTFVEKYSTIKKLKLRLISDMNIENTLQVVNALPLLSELYLKIYRRQRWSVDEVIHFANQLKQVNEFYFDLENSVQFEGHTIVDLRTKLGSKWEISTNPSFRSINPSLRGVTEWYLLQRVLE